MVFLLLLSQNEGNFAEFNASNAKRTQFSDVFSTSDSSNIQQCTESGTNRFTLSNSGDASVANCNFHDISSDSRGGAIGCSTKSCYQTSVTRIFIEETTFTACKTTNNNGGGIFFSNTNDGECVISHTCASNCSSTCSSNSYGQYAYIFTEDAATCKNEVNETTITGIKKQASTYQEKALWLGNSNIVCSSVNITNNECYYYTALYCKATYDKSACTCCIIHTSIVNNSANGHSCILLYRTRSIQLIYTSNIINNNQSTDGGATIYTDVNLFINESCIIGNEGKRVFWECGDNECQIKISNCTLDSDIITSTRYTGSFTILSSIESSFINPLRHIVTGKCESSFDSYGTLTVAMNTPKRTSSCPVITPYCKCMKQQRIYSLL